MVFVYLITLDTKSFFCTFLFGITVFPLSCRSLLFYAQTYLCQLCAFCICFQHKQFNSPYCSAGPIYFIFIKQSFGGDNIFKILCNKIYQSSTLRLVLCVSFYIQILNPLEIGIYGQYERGVEFPLFFVVFIWSANSVLIYVYKKISDSISLSCFLLHE